MSQAVPAVRGGVQNPAHSAAGRQHGRQTHLQLRSGAGEAAGLCVCWWLSVCLSVVSGNRLLDGEGVFRTQELVQKYFGVLYHFVSRKTSFK